MRKPDDEIDMAQLQSWLYISSCTLARDDCDFQVQHIVNVSKRRNADMAITGALIFSGDHFLQRIEGPPDSVAAVKGSILADPRHSQIRTLAEGFVEERAFDGWALAYGARSQYVETAIAKGLKRFDESEQSGAEHFLRLLRIFA